MKARRSYRQHCGLARALDNVGERWTLLIVRDLLLGPRRYGDLLTSLDGITTNLLAKRLREMRAGGLIEKHRLLSPASGEVYALTDEGRGLEPVVRELGRWGGRFLAAPRRGDRKDIGWALLAMKRRYRGGSNFVAELVAGERRFELVLGADELRVAEKPADGALVHARSASQEALFDLFFSGVPAARLEDEGRLSVEGDRARFKELLRAFSAVPVPGGGARQKAVLGRA